MSRSRLLGGRCRRDVHGHGDFILGIGDQVHTEPNQLLIFFQDLPVRASIPEVSCLPQSASGSDVSPVVRLVCPVLWLSMALPS